MRQPAEDSPPRFGASIDPAAPWSTHLGRACEEAASAPHGGALDIVLRHLREAAGAERAFLLESSRPAAPPRVIAVSVARHDDAVSCSTQVAARALLGERPLFLADVRREPIWADGASARALSLRSALTAPLPPLDGRRSAIVLDSRLPLRVDAADGCALVRAFASLVALIRGAAVTTPGPARRTAPAPVGESPAFLKLQDDVRSAARVPLPALVVGESGSGKELVARGLHDRSPRCRKPFVAINCAAIPEALLERELFGATRGAFTGADRDHPGLFRQAEGGTVFLDEIGDMPLSLQAKLLRVIQEGTVRAVGALEERATDVRLVAATHRDLAALVAEQKFRADLRWRLEVLVLRVPPLRDRAGDLPLLAERLLDRLAARCGLKSARLDDAAAEILAAHDWPGNVRELESVLARALLRAQHGVIRADHLDVEPSQTPAPSGKRGLERAMIEDAMRASRGNMTAAALRIGWSRSALYRRIHALGLKAGGTRSSDNSTFQ